MTVPDISFLTVLLSDHRETEAQLARLNACLQSPSPVSEAVLRFRSEWRHLSADLDCHFFCEEHAFFPVLSQYKTMMLMETEHDQLSSARRAVDAVLAQPEDYALEALIQPYQAFQSALDAHIREEEQGVFPMASQLLEPEEKALVCRKLSEAQAHWIAEDGKPAVTRPAACLDVSVENLFAQPTPNRPIRYDNVFEAEHAGLHRIWLAKGEALKTHWAGQHQFLVVITGSAQLHANETQYRLFSGNSVQLAPRQPFSLEALEDCNILLMKVWPRPYFIRHK